jgi:hypothetical protein
MNRLLTLDSTLVELCASMYDWAHWSRTKGAIKIHCLLDHEGHLPVFAHVTDGQGSDRAVARSLALPTGSVVVIDRGYSDYDLFARWTEQGVFFVTRLKRNAVYARVESRSVAPGQPYPVGGSHPAQQSAGRRAAAAVAPHRGLARRPPRGNGDLDQPSGLGRLHPQRHL